MRRLLVLGAGTAGTMTVNKLRPRLDQSEWEITVVEQSDLHYYQPGYLFVPFGTYSPAELVKPTRSLLREGVRLVHAEIDRVDADAHQVLLTDGRSLGYDYLVIATGTSPRPDQTPGMLDGEWRSSIHDFYTFDGAIALHDALADFHGGRLVVQIVEMPIKCPVAPLEFSFLTDDWLRKRGMRDRTELVYVTPLPGAFTKPVASERLGGMLAERKIHLESDFVVEHIDPQAHTLVSYDEREVPYDLLVTVPLNMGADYVARSGLGNELNYVPVDRATLQSVAHPDIFVLGDASDIPASKAGSVAHFSVEMFTENFLAHIHGLPMTHLFDGHANCYVESGDGKAMLIDFNYDTQPLPGMYPVPGVGPFHLLAETRVNHLGKLGFRWMYWNLLLAGRPIPLPAHMTMAGKHPVGVAASASDDNTLEV